MEDIGAILREAYLRKGMKLTPLTVATGISTSYLSRLLNGEIKQPAPKILRSLAAALDIPYTRLMVAAGYLTRDDVQEIASGGNVDFNLVNEAAEQLRAAD
jgi:transcriptional regulator with XRE-family HTH domain